MKRIKSVILILALIIILGISPTSVSAQGGKLIAFTFDDGPSAHTAQLLDGLKSRGVPATFFMNGVNGGAGAVNYPHLLTRMRDEGHQLANHTYSHIYLTGNKAEKTATEVKNVESLLFKAMGGSYVDLVRLPGGSYNNTTLAQADSPIIMWSVDPLDWKYRNADTVYNNIISGASDGAIVLVHDLYPTSIQGALRAIDTLKTKGYEFVTVSELMRRRGVELKNGKIYNSAPNKGVNLPAYTAPVVSVTADLQALTEKVLIYTGDSGMTIRYTTDGSKPTLASAVYKGVIDLKQKTTFTVACFDKYGTRSPVTVKTVEPDPAVVAAQRKAALEQIFRQSSDNRQPDLLWFCSDLALQYPGIFSVEDELARFRTAYEKYEVLEKDGAPVEDQLKAYQKAASRSPWDDLWNDEIYGKILEIIDNPQSIAKKISKLSDDQRLVYEYLWSVLKNTEFAPDESIFPQGYDPICQSFKKRRAMPGMVNFAFAVNGTSEKFSDIEAKSWYEPYVQRILRSGIMVGKGNGKFDPMGNILICEAIKIACVVNDLYNGGNGVFVQGKPWYKVYVDYALKQGIIKPDDFEDYSKPATRAQTAYLFANAVPKKEMTKINEISGLPDVNNKTKYSDSILALFRAGVVTGRDENNTFSPGTFVYRSEAATIVARLVYPDLRIKKN